MRPCISRRTSRFSVSCHFGMKMLGQVTIQIRRSLLIWGAGPLSFSFLPSSLLICIVYEALVNLYVCTPGFDKRWWGVDKGQQICLQSAAVADTGRSNKHATTCLLTVHKLTWPLAKSFLDKFVLLEKPWEMKSWQKNLAHESEVETVELVKSDSRVLGSRTSTLSWRKLAQ